MTGKDVLNGLTPFFFSVAALFGLLLISFVVQSLMRNTKTKSLTDLKSLAQSYVSFSDNDDSSRAKSFSAGKRKSCISCVNFRDCGLVSPDLRQARIFRSSQVVSSSEIQALKLESVLDLRVLKKTCRREADNLDIELRQTSSRQKAAMMNRTNPEGTSSSEDEGYLGMHKLESRRHSDGLNKCSICTAEFGRNHGVSVPVYHSDLVPWRTKMRVFGKLPSFTKVKALGELVHLRNPEKLIASAVVNPEVMGPKILYALLLDHSKTAFAAALRLFTEEKNYPVLVHCIHGKDRTGLIIMLLLLLCDVPAKLVVADYIQSELQLKAGRDKGDLEELEDFLRTDHVIASKAETMVETIAHLDLSYGGATQYCRTIGLSDAEISAIINNFKVKADMHQQPQLHTATQGIRGMQNGKTPVKMANLEKEDSQTWKEAVPAAASEETPFKVPVISDVALQAADEAIEEELKSTFKRDSKVGKHFRKESLI